MVGGFGFRYCEIIKNNFSSILTSSITSSSPLKMKKNIFSGGTVRRQEFSVVSSGSHDPIRTYDYYSGVSDNFFQWFSGFSDGEGCFIIVKKQNLGVTGKFRFSFVYQLVLHIDDIKVLEFIQKTLNMGTITKNEKGDECKFVVSNKEGIRKLINVFDKYNLNTTKFLDYLDFKEAFNLYFSRNGDITEQLEEKLMQLKSGMNSNRTNFDMPSNHIKITTYWLLGFIEAEGSFHLWRSDIVPVFAIGLTECQLPVLVGIKEFFIKNLGFDYNSIWKLNNTSAIGVNNQKARNNSKGSVLLVIKDIRILHSYLIPFFSKVEFLSKKGLDFNDFKIICRVVYYGAHKQDRIKSLVLKLSRCMDSRSLGNSRTLEPYFITGFSDAEASFNIRITPRKDSQRWLVELSYQIGLHKKDWMLLEMIQSSLGGGVGRIRDHGKDMVELRVSTIGDLQLITDHFDKYPLITQKLADYRLFKQAFELVKRKEHLTLEGLQKIVNIRASINKGLPERLKNSFPDTIPATRPLVTNQEITHPEWLAGFVDGDGSFMVHLQKSSSHKIGFAVKLKLQITQHARDIDLMNKLADYLGCGAYKLRPNKLAGDFIVLRFTDIKDKIIPFFKLHPIQGAKSNDFSDFCQICDIIATNGHLTANGLEQIKLIKSGMNSGRLSNYSGKIPAEFLTKDERDILVNARAKLEHLFDGRIRDIATKKIIHQHESSIYKIMKPSGQVLTVQTLTESANIIGVDIKTLSKHLDVKSADNSEFTASLKGYKVKRIRVYYK